jgi:aerobic carbon-monoxide dehydrogenase medium subunit
MKPAAFTYHRPSTADEAVQMLADAGEDAHVLAGGQSLVPLMNFRVAQPSHLVDINFVDELDYIRADDGWLAVGARARQAALERSQEAARAAPLATEATRYVAHPPVRHRGTVAGSIAHADPAAELPAVLLALEGEAVVSGPGGERRIAARELFEGPLMTSIGPGELLTEVRFPAAPPGSGHAVEEVTRRHADFAVAGAAVQLRLDGGAIGEARIALFGVAATPVRASEAERTLAGDSGERLGEAAEAAVAHLDPGEDVHGGPDYRRAAAGACVERALARALERARGAS